MVGLVIAPHHDDEILGVGGTIAKMIASGHEMNVCVVTKGCAPLFDENVVEQVRRESNLAHERIGIKKTYYLDYPAAMLETVDRYKLNGAILEAIVETKPDVVFIPHRGDMQIDHKIVADACMVALRPKYNHNIKSIYAYETVSETGWDIPNVVNEFIPNVYSDITDYIETKVELFSFYESQIGDYPDMRSERTIRALASYRGSSVNVEAAEAFMLIRDMI